MFTLNLPEEEIIMKLSVTRPIGNREVVSNFVGNMLTRAGGDIAHAVKLILTKDTLYMEYIGHGAIGYAKETRDIEQVKLQDIKSFAVTVQDSEENIKIETDKKEYTFIRDNTDVDSLALAMSKAINELRSNPNL